MAKAHNLSSKLSLNDVKESVREIFFDAVDKNQLKKNSNHLWHQVSKQYGLDLCPGALEVIENYNKQKRESVAIDISSTLKRNNLGLDKEEKLESGNLDLKELSKVDPKIAAVIDVLALTMKQNQDGYDKVKAAVKSTSNKSSLMIGGVNVVQVVATVAALIIIQLIDRYVIKSA